MQVSKKKISISLRDNGEISGSVEAIVAAIMSVPRIGWNDAAQSIYGSLAPFGIPVNRFTGAYWDHCLERAMEGCIDSGVDWMLTFDYDSMVSFKDIRNMLGRMAANPDADAIVAVQSKRGCMDQVLLTINDDAGNRLEEVPAKIFDSALTRIATAHFGCTLIRVNKISKMDKPWFQHVPGPDGSWNDGRIDSDVNFWRKWAAAGNTLYLANKVRIGHLQLMATYPAEDFSPVNIHISDVIEAMKDTDAN